MSKQSSFDRWFYGESGLSSDHMKPVNNFDKEFSSFSDWLERHIRMAYYAGYDRGMEVEAALQELSDLGQEFEG